MPPDDYQMASPIVRYDRQIRRLCSRTCRRKNRLYVDQCGQNL